MGSTFDGLKVVVSGGGSGIGAACVRLLSSQGAHVLAVDIDEANLEAVMRDAGSGKASHRVVDVTRRDQVAELFEHVEGLPGRLYGLVNCAGVRGVGALLDVDPESWDRVLAINLTGVLNMCQAFARRVVEQTEPQPTSIVNMSSGAGIRAVPNRISYVASKFGLVGISQTMALELAGRGVRVNVVAPGMIRTPLTAALFEDPQTAAGIRAANPMGREGRPEEVAAVVRFLLSTDSSFVNGAVLPVDGGNTVGVPSYSPNPG